MRGRHAELSTSRPATANGAIRRYSTCETACSSIPPQKLVAVQFFILPPYVAIESARHLLSGEHHST